ncbi:outer membrane autotransporter domain-containing protein [Escherichia coli]|nr:outer membrane autotransporter domain-containing protein [Escherichia coli]
MRVDGQNSLLETFNMYVGTSGTGTLTLTNSGTLNVEGGEVYLGVFEPAVGTLNIGAAHGEAAADAGYITNATKVEFGSGEGVFVFNHTGVLRRNRRNFRYPSFKPATNVSRSISSLLFWKV